MVSQLDAAFNYNDLNGLNNVKSLARKDDPQALKTVAQQFESMFINMVLKSMRDATDVMSSDMLSSNETKFYRDMHDQQLSLSMSQTGGYGLADVLYEQLSAQLPQRDADFNNINIRDLNASGRPVLPAQPERTPESDRPAFAPNASQPAESAKAVELPQQTSAFESPENFIERLLPYAEQAAQKLGVEPRVLLAQAALETGWGKHLIRNDEGAVANNFFGIKADQRWNGEVADTMTHEYFDGRRMSVRDAFRAYGNPGESFNDYVDFLTSNARYQPAIQQADDPAAYARALQEAGYATDPHYADKILRIADSDVMQLAMSGNVNRTRIG